MPFIGTRGMYIHKLDLASASPQSFTTLSLGAKDLALAGVPAAFLTRRIVAKSAYVVLLSPTRLTLLYSTQAPHMRLLHTETLALQSFVAPDQVQGGYAILSHVWGEHETIYQDVERFHTESLITGTSPRTLVSEKIRRACELAASHGYQWLWIDTCCIDKTSSAELSEAINSMYRYYSLAEVCYAYLEDVPTAQAFDDRAYPYEPSFTRSKWHKRGWTLQELIAPHVVIFLSASWEVLGTKSSLAKYLRKITGIPMSVLHLAQSPESVSVACRMSWASNRRTTREEDEAYSLLGIFGINMPTLYGEGRRAFRRLQEEILRKYDDTTLFAWTRYYDKTVSKLEDARSSIFAASPEDFARSGDIKFSHASAKQARLDDAHNETVRSTLNYVGVYELTHQ